MNENIKIGDIVRFLDEIGGGRITGFKGKDIVLVEDEDGFEIPTSKKSVVVVESADNSTIKEENIREEVSTFEEKEEEIIKPKASEDVSKIKPSILDDILPKLENWNKDDFDIEMCIVPAINRDFEAFMVNNTPMSLLFTFSVMLNGEWKLIRSSKAEPRHIVSLTDIQKENVDYFSRILIQIIYFSENSGYEMRIPLNVEKKILPAKFFKTETFKENKYFSSDALFFNLLENKEEDEHQHDKYSKPLSGIKIIDKIDLSKFNKGNKRARR